MVVNLTSRTLTWLHHLRFRVGNSREERPLGIETRGFPWVDFVLFAQPRTGSNWLCSRLNQIPNVTMHYELFHESRPFYSEKIRGGHNILKTPNERDADIDSFLKMISRDDLGNIIGFKLFPWQNSALEERILSSNVKKILLFRENALAQFASDLVAIATNSFGMEDERSDIAVEENLPIFDQKTFEEWYYGRLQWYENIVKRSAKSGGCYILCYENLSIDFVFRSTIQFIGIRPDREFPIQETPRRKRQIKVPARFKNAADVEEYLERNNLMKWYFD